MKHVLSHLVVACGLAVAAAGSASAWAAGSSSSNNVTVLPTETIGSNEPTPEAPAAARKEAHAALAEAERACRRENARDTRQSCLAAAQEDFRATLARARTGS